jgi:hypothetical protein
MRKLVAAALLALPLTAALPQQLQAGGGCYNLQGGFKLKICYDSFFKCSHEPWCGNGGGYGGGYGGNGGGNGGGGAWSPWYLYWPAEAHFQTPAPTGYPYWPSPMTPSVGVPPGGPTGHGGTTLTGYHYGVPSYWYGR